MNMKMTKRGERQIVYLFGLIFISFLFIQCVSAVPQTFNIHGRLTDSSGTALSGTYNLSFKIYDVYSGGTELWSMINRSITTDTSGIYDVVLTDVNLNGSDQYYLGISVFPDSEMSPRLNLTSTPYSIRSNYSENLVCSGCINGSQLASNIVLNENKNISGNYNFSFFNGGLFISNSSRVGIGTTSPSHQLQVIGSTNITGSLYVGTVNTSYYGLNLYTNNIAYSIGQSNLDSWPASDSGLQISTTSGADRKFYFYNSNSGYNMDVLVEGKVGIGTITPQEKLHVNGSILANGTINATGDVCIQGGSCLSNVGSASSSAGWSNTTTTTSTGLNVNITTGNLTIPNGRIGKRFTLDIDE